jgi:hypothetical protein
LPLGFPASVVDDPFRLRAVRKINFEERLELKIDVDEQTNDAVY